MPKVKIIKEYTTYYDYDDYSSTSVLYPYTEDWEEVDQETIDKLKSSMYKANMKRDINKDGHFRLVEYSEEYTPELIFKLASEWLKEQEAIAEKERLKNEAAKKKREEQALERKRKQLEKLKKELDEQ